MARIQPTTHQTKLPSVGDILYLESDSDWRLCRNHSVVPAARLLSSLVLVEIRRFLCSFVFLQLLTDELSHLLSLLWVALFVCIHVVVVDIPLNLIVRLEEPDKTYNQRKATLIRLLFFFFTARLTHLSCFSWCSLLLFPLYGLEYRLMLDREKDCVQRRIVELLSSLIICTYLSTAGTELSLGSSFRRSWLLLLFPLNV